MIKIVAVLLVIVLLFIYNIKKKRSWTTPSSFLLSLYVLSLICAIVDIFIGYDTPYILSDGYILSSLFFVALFLGFMLPFISFNEEAVEFLVFPNKKFLDVASNALIVLSISAIVYYIPSIISVFSYGSLNSARNDRYFYDVSFVEVGLTYTFFSVVSSLFVFCLLFFFIYYTIGGHKKKCILLLFSSLSETFHVLTEVGRDGIVFWLFTFIFLSLLFRNYLKESKRQTLKKYFIVLSCIISVPFLLISFSRFSEDVFAGLVSYMGQQYKHFCYYVALPNAPSSDGYIFPLFWEVLGLDRPERAKFDLEITDSGAFGTFMRSFIENLHIWGTIIACFLMGLFYKLSMRKTHWKLPLSNLIIYLLYFEVYSQGVFYFRHYTRGGNLFIVICIMGYLFFKHYPNRQGSVILKKQHYDKKQGRTKSLLKRRFTSL